MSGHLEHAAGALNAASQALPIEHVRTASAQIQNVVQAIQQAGGARGQELIQCALAVQSELDTLADKLAELRERLNSAAVIALQGGT
ncbi:hypothetical protein [Actinokineospora sp.]|uniref:hypothetical protein n=1 Tax=Actinokineospora sp. TaxID=1872133 RepID=UPI004037E6DA